MHGQHREDTKQKRHMWSELSGIHVTEADSARLKSFSKGGRKIAVGATALFQAGDALPFIGIIRKVHAEKEGAVKLCVNWLYRPGDIELAKGISLEAAPNEIFYSFHKDEISAASLLHPCKVAFLPKGVQLPSTVSHFVCRRVYDTSNKCLYWLTDQDYTDEHQGEVNRLLNKTKHEMQAGAHSERPSQRALSELTSPKRETVNVAPTSQGKSKKRERTDQNSDSSRREKLTKVEEVEVEVEVEVKLESTMKFEDFAAIAHKEGGLTSTPSVDQLVQVMSEDRNDALKKLVDVVQRRTLLAGIIAGTEREECLAQFVRLGGLPMLDGWLQEAHKGKPGEGDKGLEELLLVLLRALERLPVDLDALKTCNVGKSVNNLKSHKNPKVQKKARKLVATWKKRVDAEMNSIDEAKSGLNSATTWSSRPSVETPTSKGGFAGGSKSTNGTGPSGETTSLSAYKDLPETVLSKDNPGKAHLSGISEVPMVVKEEKSCSSSQSQNNSQSWCSGSTKGAGSWKEEGKALSVVSGVNKSVGTALHSHTKTHPAASSMGFQRDLAGRNKTSGLERMGSGAFTDKKPGEVVRAENHNSQRLIVRLPNPGRSPAHSTSGGGLIEGGASTNRVSSPNMMDKHDSLNGSSRGPDIHSPDTSGDTKCGNSAAKFATDCKEETNRSCIATTGGDVPCKSSADIKQRPKSHLTVQSTPATHLGTVKKGSNSSVTTTTPASSNINPVSFDLDTAKGGIDLLASIAACEGAEAEKSFRESTGGEGQPCTTEGNKDSAGPERVVNGPEPNSKGIEDGDEQKKDGEPKCGLERAAALVRESDPLKDTKLTDSLKDVSSTATREKEQQGPALTGSLKVHMAGASESEMKASSPGIPETTVGSKLERESAGKPAPGVCIPELLTDAGGEISTTGGLDNDDPLQEGAEDGSKAHSSPGTPTKSPSPRANSEDLGTGFYEEDALEVARLVAMEVEQEVQRYGLPDMQEACSLSRDKRSSSLEKAIDESPKYKPTMSPDSASASMKDVSAERPIADAALTDANLGSLREGKRDTGGEVNESLSLVKDDAKWRPDLESAEDSVGAAKEVHKVDAHDQSLVAGVSGTGEASVADKDDLLPKDRSHGNTSDVVERPVFDLNEGLQADEGPHDRASGPPTMAAPVPDRSSCFPAHASSLAVPVAVVSAMKGAFIPPANISRPKGELGWKGSAATSAFRPAEPRRVAEALQSPFADATPTLGSIGTNSDQNGKQARFLDIDLNVADERMMEDSVMASTHEADVVSNGPAASRLELDLNRVDESDESAVLPESNGRSSHTASRPMLDFDLNDGLGSEEAGVDEVSSSCDKCHENSGVPPLFSEARQPAEFVNVLPWYTSASSVPPAMVIPAFSGARPDSPYPVLAASSAKSVIGTNHNFNQFGGNTYRPGVPMSSASVPYTAAAIPTGFSHAGFPFGAGYPFTSSSSYNLSSATNATLTNTLPFPAATPSQLVSAGAVVPSFGRPYLGSYIGEASRADPGVSWVKSGLDLNAGPEVIADSEGAREEGYGVRSAGVGHGQLSYQQVGALSGPLKRKEPEGGFDPFRANFKQMTWREL